MTLLCKLLGHTWKPLFTIRYCEHCAAYDEYDFSDELFVAMAIDPGRRR